MSTTPKMIDGKAAMLAFCRNYHPRFEHAIVDLEKQLRGIGCELTDADEDRVIIAGPMLTTAVCKTQVLFGGAMRVKHFHVVQALERLLEVGVPVWAGELEQFAWHCAQLERCAAFQIPQVEEFETREDMESHVATCGRCQPSFAVLKQAVDGGSSRTGDEYLKELIVRAHENATAALEFYRSVHAATFGAMISSAATEKPSRKRTEVLA